MEEKQWDFDEGEVSSAPETIEESKLWLNWHWD